MTVPDDHSFALGLTHDVDRPFKTYQAAFRGVRDRSAYHLGTLRPGRNPYWQFDEIMSLEDELGVRSSFYFLREPPLHRMGGPTEWLRPVNWIEHLGRYDFTTGELPSVIRRLADGGWEVGLHGSRRSHRDPERMLAEKRRLESVLGGNVVGCRHHHLTHTPETWEHQRRAGLEYDASPGSSSTYGFQHGYEPKRPFDDTFLVFPLTAMEVALPDPGESFEAAEAACESLLREAASNDAVMTVLWHPRLFNEREFPGYRRLYRRLVEGALERDAWVGPLGTLHESITQRSDAERALTTDS